LSAKSANQNVVQLPDTASATAKARVGMQTETAAQVQPSVAQDMVAKAETKKLDDAATAQQALNGMGNKASGQAQVQAQAHAQGEGLLQQHAGSAQNAQQAPTADNAAANQNMNFAATLENSSSLRNLNQVTPMDAQLRHAPTQGENPAEQVKVHLQNALADGSRRMEIQLKPHELGRVDVRIDTDADGKSHVTVTADKRDTLDMLQRDARSLERALADAGLKADSNSLSFNLRGDEGQQQAKQEQQDKSQQAKFDLNGDYADDLESKLDTSEMALTYDAGRAYRLSLDWGLDISV
jgi:flagellar hook-length control protein FliK